MLKEDTQTNQESKSCKAILSSICSYSTNPQLCVNQLKQTHTQKSKHHESTSTENPVVALAVCDGKSKHIYITNHTALGHYINLCLANHFWLILLFPHWTFHPYPFPLFFPFLSEQVSTSFSPAAKRTFGMPKYFSRYFITDIFLPSDRTRGNGFCESLNTEGLSKLC